MSETGQEILKRLEEVEAKLADRDAQTAPEQTEIEKSMKWLYRKTHKVSISCHDHFGKEHWYVSFGYGAKETTLEAASLSVALTCAVNHVNEHPRG